MNIGATGIVIDHYGDVLLIQRNDTRTLAPPGGSAEIGELPTDTVEREVKEETGLIVMPVRLVGLYFFPTSNQSYLSFCYRCIMRGGDLQKSDEALESGFFKTKPLPKPILDFHKKRVVQSLEHHYGPPLLVIQPFPWQMRLGKWVLDHVVYPWLDFRRRRQGIDGYTPPPQWQLTNYLIIKNKEGKIAWVKSEKSGEWILPFIESQNSEAPWQTVLRVVNNKKNIGFKLTGLSGIYTDPNRPKMAMTYSANYSEGVPEFNKAWHVEYRSLGDEQPATNTQHLSWIQAAAGLEDGVHYERSHLT